MQKSCNIPSFFRSGLKIWQVCKFEVTPLSGVMVGFTRKRSRSTKNRRVSTSVNILLVPWIKNHLNSFKLGFQNIFSRYNLSRSLSLLLFLLWRNGQDAKKCPKNHIRFDFWDEWILPNQGTWRTIERSLKGLSWNQQYWTFRLFCQKWFKF